MFYLFRVLYSFGSGCSVVIFVCAVTYSKQQIWFTHKCAYYEQRKPNNNTIAASTAVGDKTNCNIVDASAVTVGGLLTAINTFYWLLQKTSKFLESYFIKILSFSKLIKKLYRKNQYLYTDYRTYQYRYIKLKFSKYAKSSDETPCNGESTETLLFKHWLQLSNIYCLNV